MTHHSPSVGLYLRCRSCGQRSDALDHDLGDEVHRLSRELGRPVRLFRTDDRP